MGHSYWQPMDTKIKVIGILGSVFLFLASLSPPTKYKEIVNDPTLSWKKSLYFTFKFLSCGLWLLYGVYHRHMLMVIANSIGVMIQVVYLVAILKYLKSGKLKVVLVISMSSVVLVVLPVLCSTLTRKQHVRALVVGIIASTVQSFTSYYPCAVMRQVMVTRSLNKMPLSSIICSFANSVCWVLYGVFPYNESILFPNMIGSLSAVVQFMVYLVYYICGDRQSNDAAANP